MLWVYALIARPAGLRSASRERRFRSIDVVRSYVFDAVPMVEHQCCRLKRGEGLLSRPC
jgi:hypothetical protein